MTVLIIPTRGDIGAYYFKVELDGVLFELSFQYNDREKHWYMDISTADGRPIRSGIKLVANFPLLRILSNSDGPQGELIVLNTRNDNDPDFKELGSIIQLAYMGKQ